MIQRDNLAEEFVLRALAASEIAEECHNPDLRLCFRQMAADWLRDARAVPGEARSFDPDPPISET